ncbi:S9 family peptidase [Halapricum salinum]|nr:alpha/beta fold hydrolase [Halapricum salinum]
MPESIAQYIEQVAGTHRPRGHTVLPDGTVVVAVYRDGAYELWTPDGCLTDTDEDVVSPRWDSSREVLLALRDEEGAERYDLVEVDPETGAVTPILADEFLVTNPQSQPAKGEKIAFVSNRDQSLDLYTVDRDAGGVVKHSETAESVRGYAWAPDGKQLVYQAGLIDGAALRLVDLRAGTDEVLFDEPESEQSLAYIDGGRGAWSDTGIVFTTNHATGYREIAVGDTDGSYDVAFTNERDKYDPRWTATGDIAFVESRGGNRVLRRFNGSDVTTLEDHGMNIDLTATADGVSYVHLCTATAGDIRRNGAVLREDEQVTFPTATPQEVTYDTRDGVEIAARLYTPAEQADAAIVFPHGGPPAQHYNWLNPVPQALVYAGFEVLAPDYRGSIGYGRAFRKASDGDLGGCDLDDVVAGAEFLRARGHDSVGIAGMSYGGYLTLMGVGATDAFDAGASICGVVNWETAAENARQFLGDYLIRKLGGTPAENPDLYRERSPIHYVAEIQDPLFIVQGRNDPRVPEGQAEELVSSLRDRDIPHEYLLFEDEGHEITCTENRVKMGNQLVSFFDAHL